MSFMGPTEVRQIGLQLTKYFDMPSIDGLLLYFASSVIKLLLEISNVIASTRD